jgi:4-hydroxy-L-threonine phosphate dehydrogenase PdxA
LNQIPVVATMIGDPCGIGPEVVIKALAGSVGPAQPLLIGDAQVVRDAIALTKAPFSVRPVAALEDARFAPGCLDVLDPGTLDYREVTPGRLSAACGKAVSEWWNITTQLARDKRVAAIVKAPTNSEAIRLGGGTAHTAAPAPATYLFLITGPLRVVHLTDHIPLREVLARVRKDEILQLIRLTHESLRGWGIAAPRIGVAGLNPHAYGDEERQEIAPAVESARALGIDAQGPVSPDSLFRLCAEGVYDCVIAHYHDQGHIAVKTWRFDGNCAVLLGEPYLRVSVAHGTAFDIAGRGIADHRSMAAAIKTAAMLAAGQGFPRE